MGYGSYVKLTEGSLILGDGRIMMGSSTFNVTLGLVSSSFLCSICDQMMFSRIDFHDFRRVAQPPDVYSVRVH